MLLSFSGSSNAGVPPKGVEGDVVVVTVGEDELPIVGVGVLTAERGVDDGVGAGAGCLLNNRNIPEMRATNMPLPAAIKAALTGGSKLL